MTKTDAKSILTKLLETTDPTTGKHFFLHFVDKVLTLTPAKNVKYQIIRIGTITARDITYGLTATQWAIFTEAIYKMYERLYPCQGP